MARGRIMRRSVDTDKLMDGLGRLATDTDLCKRYGNCTPWIPYSAVRKLISDMILEEKESCDDAVSRKAMLSMIDTYMNKSVELHYLPTSDGIKKLISILPSVQPEQRWIPVLEESVIQAGYEGREVRFRIHGRLFAIRELAQ